MDQHPRMEYVETSSMALVFTEIAVETRFCNSTETTEDGKKTARKFKTGYIYDKSANLAVMACS